MKNTDQIIDDYITREDTITHYGKCSYCGDLLEDHPITVDGNNFCSDECIVDYYKLSVVDNMKYCTCCDYSLGEDYIQDPNGDMFCNIECFKKYYE